MCDVFKVAKEICKNRDWKVSNLELQKILYIAQVFSLGQRGTHIFNSKIEAWDYGPVVPKVYRAFKALGNTAIPEFLFPSTSENCTPDELVFINNISSMLDGIEPWGLVAITHRDNSAWRNTYKPNENLEITEKAMIDEYNNLWAVR
jgi:uncharacterized phage-associated protein